MPLHFRCPKCSMAYHTDSRHANRETTCPRCLEKFTIPASATPQIGNATSVHQPSEIRQSDSNPTGHLKLATQAKEQTLPPSTTGKKSFASKWKWLLLSAAMLSLFGTSILFVVASQPSRPPSTSEGATEIALRKDKDKTDIPFDPKIEPAPDQPLHENLPPLEQSSGHRQGPKEIALPAPTIGSPSAPPVRNSPPPKSKSDAAAPEQNNGSNGNDPPRQAPLPMVNPLPKMDQPNIRPKDDEGIPPKPLVANDIPSLEKALKAEDQATKIAALQALRAKGIEAKSTAAAICDCLLTNQKDLQLAALEALERVRPDLYPPVLTLLTDSSSLNRLDAMDDLKRMGKNASPTITLLESELNKNPVRLKAPLGRLIPSDVIPSDVILTTILQIDPNNSVAHEFLKNSAQKGDLRAIRFLYQRAGTDEVKRKELLPLLGKLLNSEHEISVVSAVTICGEYGQLAIDFLPKIKELKISGTASIREAAHQATSRLEAIRK